MAMRLLDPWRRLALSVLFAVALTAGFVATPGAAQQPDLGQGGESAQPVSAAELESLVGTLQDPAARERLVGDLKALIEARRAGVGDGAGAAPGQSGGQQGGFGSSVLQKLSLSVDALSQQLVEALRALGALPGALIEAAGTLKDPAVRDRLLEIVGKLVLIFAAAVAGEFIAKRLLARPRRGLESRSGAAYLSRLIFLLLRTIVDVVPLAVFAAVAYGVLPLTEPRPVTSLVALILINANVLSRVVAVAGRAVFAPEAGGLRLLPLSDESGNYGYIWLRRFTVVGVYGYFLLEAARWLGLHRAAYDLLLNFLGLLLAGMLIVLLLQLRASVAGWLRGGAEGRFTSLRVRLADFWHVIAIIYVMAVYLVWLLDLPGGFNFLLRATLLSLLILIGARLAAVFVGHAVERGFRLNQDLQSRYPLLEARLNRYLPVLRRIMAAAIAIVAVLLLLEAWGAAPFAWLGSDAGSNVVGGLFSILLILGGALLVLEIFGAVVEGYLQRRAQDPAIGSARVATLLPLAQNALRVLLAVMVVLIVLSELGIDIAPLLAGAGVVGLAIGFGAQTLVKDVITGIFILLEDTVSVGDVVEVGGRSGVVEGLTIRTIRLRDVEGSLHVLPFSDVTAVKNFGRQFAYALIEMGVGYREDVDEVIGVMREVAAELCEDPEYRDAILGELQVMGLDRFDDSAVVIRVRFKTRPFMQWSVRREYNRRLKRAFDAQGIEIPFPHITLYFGEAKDGSAPPMHLVQERAKPRKPAAPQPSAPPAPTSPPVSEMPMAHEGSGDEAAGPAKTPGDPDGSRG